MSPRDATLSGARRCSFVRSDDYARRRPAGRAAADAQHRRRVRSCSSAGIGMVGGLLVSRVLTLFTTPVIYLLFDQLALWVPLPET